MNNLVDYIERHLFVDGDMVNVVILRSPNLDRLQIEIEGELAFTIIPGKPESDVYVSGSHNFNLFYADPPK